VRCDACRKLINALRLAVPHVGVGHHKLGEGDFFNVTGDR
jgi:hypothetical protein